MEEVYVLEDLLNTLIELKTRGFAFYEGHRKSTEDRKLKELFGELAIEEKNHEIFYKGIKKRILNDFEASVDDEYKEYITNLINYSFIFLNKDFSIKTVKEALDIAENLEKETIIFMNEINEIVDERLGFKVILEEEKRHLLRIYQYKKEQGIR